MTLSAAFLDELRDRLPLSGVIGRRVKLEKKGREHQGLCPFHTEKSPSFTVNDDKGFFHCFGCGAHGDVIAFEMRAGHLGFIEAVERLAEEAGLEVPTATPEDRARDQRRASLYEALEAAAGWYVARLHAPEGEPGLAYLRQRGLSDDSIARFGLGWAPEHGGLRTALPGARYPEALLLEAGLLFRREDGSIRDLFRGRVMFPIHDRRGRVIGFGARTLGDDQPKYLNSPQTPLFDKGATLYGLAIAREGIGKAGRAVLVEGYLDVIAAHQAGIDQAVAPLGTAVTERQLDLVWRIAPELVACLDGDQPGIKAARRIVDLALPQLAPERRARIATLPPEHDPDSLIRAEGADALRAVIAAAAPLPDVAWEMALAACPPSGPEQAAALERDLWRRACGIVDAATRRQVLAEYRRRLRYVAGPPLSTVRLGRSATAPAPYRGRLAGEWDRARAAAETGPVRSWLKDNGIIWDALSAALGGVGFARGKRIRGRWVEGEQWAAVPRPALWDPCETGGESLVILPVWDGVPGQSALVDLIGWNPRSQDLHQRSGAAAVIGEDLIVEARGYEALGMPRPVVVAATPLSWLQRTAAGLPSVLVVDWGRAWDSFAGLSAVVAETVELGRFIRGRLHPPALPRPEIYVEGDFEGDAA